VFGVRSGGYAQPKAKDNSPTSSIECGQGALLNSGGACTVRGPGPNFYPLGLLKSGNFNGFGQTDVLVIAGLAEADRESAVILVIEK
jgi:hypothetical protein